MLQVKDDSPFALADVKLLKTTDTPEKALQDKAEVRVVPRPAQKASGGPGGSGRPRCKNYGCQCEFDEATNDDAACRHHARAPIFHDTRKWWQCCEGVKVYSFDEMMQIPGCVIGRHSTEPPAEEKERQKAMAEATAATLSMHVSAAKPSSDGRAPAPKQEFTPSEAPKQPKKKEQLKEGQARCRHYGCQALYAVAENNDSACTYHSSAPFFHEGSKQWQCCGVKKWDFDDFLAVPGCKVGPHEPVE